MRLTFYIALVLTACGPKQSQEKGADSSLATISVDQSAVMAKILNSNATQKDLMTLAEFKLDLNSEKANCKISLSNSTIGDDASKAARVTKGCDYSANFRLVSKTGKNLLVTKGGKQPFKVDANAGDTYKLTVTMCLENNIQKEDKSTDILKSDLKKCEPIDLDPNGKGDANVNIEISFGNDAEKKASLSVADYVSILGFTYGVSPDAVKAKLGDATETAKLYDSNNIVAGDSYRYGNSTSSAPFSFSVSKKSAAVHSWIIHKECLSFLATKGIDTKDLRIKVLDMKVSDVKNLLGKPNKEEVYDYGVGFGKVKALVYEAKVDGKGIALWIACPETSSTCLRIDLLWPDLW